MVREGTQHYVFYVSSLVGEQSQKHQFGAGVQIWWSGAQDRSLLKQRGTRSPSTKCAHGGTGNPKGDALS